MIRAAQPKDVSQLADILADSFHSPHGIKRWAYPLLRLGIYEDLRSRLRSTSPNYLCLVAVASTPAQAGSPEYLAGTVEMTLRSSLSWQLRGSQYPYISNLAVHSSYRRQGVAQQLLISCERTALEWGFQDIYLHVLENNDQARKLYIKRGYHLQQVDPDWSHWLFNQPRRLFLHKQLTASR